MKDVMTNRELMKNAMRKELQEQLTGWGIWLETVEIKNVRICSKNLFEDLQAEFRNEQRMNAEAIRLKTQTQINEN